MEKPLFFNAFRSPDLSQGRQGRHNAELEGKSRVDFAQKVAMNKTQARPGTKNLLWIWQQKPRDVYKAMTTIDWETFETIIRWKSCFYNLKI